MKLLHLYHDIMNLYGEYGNICMLTRMLEKNGVEYELKLLSLQDEVHPLDYDFIYVGSGTEKNQKRVLSHMHIFKEELQAYIEADKVLLMTGNSFELLGEKIIDASEKVWQGLSLCSFQTKEQNRSRMTGDAVFIMEEMSKKIVGFINKCSVLKGIDTPLFQVQMGLGNQEQDKKEGIRRKNFFGTHLTGPLLVKNPYMLIWICEILCKNKKLDSSWMEREKAAYEVSLRELENRIK